MLSGANAKYLPAHPCVCYSSVIKPGLGTTGSPPRWLGTFIFPAAIISPHRQHPTEHISMVHRLYHR